MPWMPDLISVVTGTEGHISQATVDKISLTLSSEQFDMPFARLVIR